MNSLYIIIFVLASIVLLFILFGIYYLACHKLRNKHRTIFRYHNKKIVAKQSWSNVKFSDDNSAMFATDSKASWGIVIGKFVGFGSFGIVHKARKTTFDQKCDTTVAVKTMCSLDNSKQQSGEILNEIQTLRGLKHHLNVITILHACRSNPMKDRQVSLVLEYCNYGDLKQYLVLNKEAFFHNEENPLIDHRRLLLTWTYDIAKGMRHLFRQNTLHGDLSLQNVLIQGYTINGKIHLTAKLSDFGMSTTFPDAACYQQHRRTEGPWAWMANEASDAWCFGVTIWEMLSFGLDPYPEADSRQEFLMLDRNHQFLCPLEVKELLEMNYTPFYDRISRMCFVDDPIKRSEFPEIVDMVEKELTSEELETYVTIEKMDIDNVYTT